MLNKIFFLFFLFYCIGIANEDINKQDNQLQNATELEMFLFKIGFTSLL